VKKYFLISNNNKKLILFFNGWGMDYTIFKEIKSNEYDVILFYHYSNLNQEINFEKLFNKYKEVSLISWSMGVWVSSVICEKIKGKLKHKIAFAGTLKPVDNDYGIVTGVYKATIDNFTAIGRAKFFKRMWNGVEIPEMFKKHRTIREIEEQKQELIFLKDSFKILSKPKNIFDVVIVSENDLICPTKNQKNYWENKINYKTLNAPHFVFYHWKTWEEIIEYAISN
jgi:hypothetical protein